MVAHLPSKDQVLSSNPGMEGMKEGRNEGVRDREKERERKRKS